MVVDNRNPSELDRVWRSGGKDYLIQYFNRAVVRDRHAALRLINDDRLRFPVLYLLMQDVITHHLTAQLSERNKTALELCARKTKTIGRASEPAAARDNTAVHAALKWMLRTGKGWDGPSLLHDEYDELIDYVSAELTTVFDDKTVLPDIAELIFRRNRSGLYQHDLVWCYFQTLDPQALKQIAERLLSADYKDVELAAQMLHLDIPVPATIAELRKVYGQYVAWLDENQTYLYLTGEHLQMTSRPNHLAVDAEAKYLDKEILPRNKTPIQPLEADEIDRLHQYRLFTDEERALLTQYSHDLRQRDGDRWYEWMHQQVAEQVLAARKNYEAV